MKSKVGGSWWTEKMRLYNHNLLTLVTLPSSSKARAHFNSLMDKEPDASPECDKVRAARHTEESTLNKGLRSVEGTLEDLSPLQPQPALMPSILRLDHSPATHTSQHFCQPTEYKSNIVDSDYSVQGAKQDAPLIASAQSPPGRRRRGRGYH